MLKDESLLLGGNDLSMMLFISHGRQPCAKKEIGSLCRLRYFR